MRHISATTKGIDGKPCNVEVLQFVERGGVIVALCLYKNEIVAIAPIDLVVTN